MIARTYPAGFTRLLCLAILFSLVTAPVLAFTSNSLDITIDKNGDAIAKFTFTLEGLIENAIPESLLKEELAKGLTTSSEPPVILSFDKSGASLLLKNFSVKNDVPTGTEYLTASMDFSKAEIALKNSAVSSVISADFSPQKILVTFPDGYHKEFTDSSVLPSLKHTVIDPAKSAQAAKQASTGTISVSSSPEGVRVYIDGTLAGTAPGSFAEISPGQHQVLLEMDGFTSMTKTVSVKAGETVAVNGVLSYATPEPTPQKSGSVAGIFVTGLGLAAGMILFWRRP